MNSAHCVDSRPPDLQLLSNGSYHVMVNSGGGGYSRWKNLSITRWREDATCDHWGAFCYLRDRSNGDVWSTSYQPTQRPAIDSDPVFEAGRASFHTRHQGIDMDSDIAVSPDDDVELCRVQISNHSAAAKDLDVTSYREIALAPLLTDAEVSHYDLPTRSQETATLYEHCRRAVNRALQFGVHGLPLMGGGDWNDGMNLVGAGGQGESVWLGFFLCAVLTQFSELAKRRGDALFASRCTTEAGRLQSAIEGSAWDGDWYRRGWFDDGSPLGTAGNLECCITSIPQSWSVLSGAGDSDRACRAMQSVDTHLVDRNAALIRLLDPPFDHSNPSPGYIQGYVRGIRENGGQYTHAAVWAAMAFAALGDTERTWELVNMINPIKHSESATVIAVYKSEPYVVASDVYSLAPHAGRGGWTWYTGSAGWMYRLILESLLGLTVNSNLLRIAPCMPRDWKSFKIHYRYHDTLYDILVFEAGEGEEGGLILDGVAVTGPAITLIDDRLAHTVEVQIPPQASAALASEQAA